MWAIAQLGERLHGMQEVSGSIPLSSTKFKPSSQDGVLYLVKCLDSFCCQQCRFLYITSIQINKQVYK